MKYYKLKCEYFDSVNNYTFVKNELLTEKELNRFSIPGDNLVIIYWNRFDTYWNFGARFQSEPVHHNKTEIALIQSYQRATDVTLDDCYSSHSYAKDRAYAYCMSRLNELGGRNHRICSYNTFTFTFAFRYINRATGALHLYYKTAYSTYDIPLMLVDSDNTDWHIFYDDIAMY